MSEPIELQLKIAGREYTIACQPAERDALLKSAELLDEKMRDIRANHRMAGLDVVAVLAALNFAHELLQLRDREAGRDHQLNRDLESLGLRVQHLLGIAKS